MMKRIFAMLHARNLEFVRDRSSLTWNLVLPVLLVVGLAFAFSGDNKDQYKVAVMADNLAENAEPDTLLHPILKAQYVKYYGVEDQEKTIAKVSRHQVDMLLDLRSGENKYWVNSDAVSGYFMQQLLAASGGPKITKQAVTGKEIRYVDWVVPGILGMNIMFGCLFGVGYVIVRYRKSGYLKRVSATPLSSTEFLIAQILSRLLIVVATTSLVFAGTNFFMDFRVEGSYLDLLLVLVVGTFSLLALGLLVASRVTSEELAGGLLNMLTWPMMLLSGVWFSMEGAHPILQKIADISPLTHMLKAARGIMIDGQPLMELSHHLAVLLVMGVVFIVLGAWMFKWSSD